MEDRTTCSQRQAQEISPPDQSTLDYLSCYNIFCKFLSFPLTNSSSYCFYRCPAAPCYKHSILKAVVTKSSFPRAKWAIWGKVSCFCNYNVMLGLWALLYVSLPLAIFATALDLGHNSWCKSTYVVSGHH